MKTQAGFAALVALSLTGCTSLNTAPDIASSGAVIGAPYSLPLLQYDIKITGSVVQCYEPQDEPPAKPAAKAKKGAKPAAAVPEPAKIDNLKLVVKVEGAPNYVAGETYVIDYRKLAGWSKISSLTVEYQEGSTLLKSVNASVEDRSAEIAGNAIKGALGVASLIGGIPLPSGAKAQTEASLPKDKKQLICKASTQKLLDDVEKFIAQVEDRTDKLKAATAAVDELANRKADLSDADKTKLTELTKAQAKAVKALNVAKANLAEAQAPLSFTITRKWPELPSQEDSIIDPDATSIAKLANLLDLGDTVDDKKNKNLCDNTVAVCLGRKLTTLARLDRAVPAPTTSITPGKPTSKDDLKDRVVAVANTGSKGLLVRPPVQGRLLVCGAASIGACTEASPDLLLRTDLTAVPQLGTLRFLPFENQMFQNNSLSVTLAKTGEITKLEYKEPKATGETASAALLSAINDVRGYADKLDAKRTADKAAAEKEAKDAILAGRTDTLAGIQYQIDLLQKQKALDELNKPAEVTAISAMNAETAEINARIALLKAKAAERDAEAALGQ